MKTQFKMAAAALLLLTGSITVKAQSNNDSGRGILYSVGVESGITSGGTRNLYRWSLGGSLQADIPVARQWFVTANAGYQNYFSKDLSSTANLSGVDLHVIPVKGGVKFFPAPAFYLQVEGGADFLLNKNKLGYQRTVAFVYAPQLGYQFRLGSSEYLDAGFRYERTTDFTESISSSKINVFALRVAYAFQFK